jgi:hypothetical protein
MSQALIKIARAGKSIGEYSLTDLGLALRAKTVLLSDYYWRPGMKDWERVQLIATEAEGAVTLTASPAPTPPSAGMETKEITATSPMSRLHLTIGGVALVYSLWLFLFAKTLGDLFSRLIVGMEMGDVPSLETAQVVARAVGKLITYALLILVAWIVSKVTYFIVLGKRREADNKPIKYGDAFFVAAIVIGFCAIFYALLQPGVNATVLRASRSS